MRVAVVAAMRNEMRPFSSLLENGRLGSIEVITRVVGIGTELAARTTRSLLEEESVDHVVMIGIAGGVGPTVKIADLVAPEVVVDAHGADWRPVALPGFAPRGKMRTSDEIDVTPDELVQLEAAGFIALDMETAAVGRVSEERGVTWSVVRSISDHCDDGFVDSSVLAMTNADGSPNFGAVVRYLGPRPWRMARLSRLARDSKRATVASAQAAASAIRALA